MRHLPIKLLPFVLLLPGALLCAAPGGVSGDELRKLADSLFRWHAENRSDALAQNLGSWWTDETAGTLEVRLLRADSSMKAQFRRRVHDSPRIRLGGFDPDTTPYTPAPEGPAPPKGLTMRAAHAHYLPGTERVIVTIRYRGSGEILFGTDYTLARFQHGRWEVLPVGNDWKSLLIGLGRPVPPPPGPPRPAPAEGYTHTFSAWLAPCLFPAEYARYRILKRVWTEHPHREYLLSTEFTVMPWSLWTRFDDEPATP